jgi:hypothetical protein
MRLSDGSCATGETKNFPSDSNEMELLAMTRAQVLDALDARDPAAPLHLPDTASGQARAGAELIPDT